MSRRDPRQSRRLSAGVPFNPTLIAGCVLWLRADLGITLNGSTVSAWADHSGSGNIPSVTQGTASQQPTYNTSDAAFNGAPTLSFNGAANQVLTKSSAVPTIAQPFTVIACGLTGASGFQSFTGSSIGPSGQIGGDAGNVYMYGGTTVVTTTSAVTSACVVAGAFNGASSSLYKNNSQTAATTGSPGGGSIVTDFEVGAAVPAGTSNQLTGKVAEVIVYTGTLSAGDLKRVFAYLGSRYGIAVS